MPNLTTLSTPIVPGKAGSSSFFAVLILIVIGFVLYKFFSLRNEAMADKAEKEEKRIEELEAELAKAEAEAKERRRIHEKTEYRDNNPNAI